MKASDTLLHFAPEVVIQDYFRAKAKKYLSADLSGLRVDLKLNIENIDLTNESFDVVICSHVLEHVDDRRALREIYRILRPSGRLICMIPIVEGWDTTYENEAVTLANDRELHFGQYDHVRYYGRDFRARVQDAGFVLKEYTADAPDVIRYGLLRGEKVFVCEKR